MTSRACPFQKLSIWQKHTLLFRYENRPYKYAFLHAFFLICPPCPFQNLSIWPKTHPFFPIFQYAFLHAFFLICPPCPFQNLSIWPKTHLFFPILHVFALLSDVRAYIAWSWKTTLINFFSRMISNLKYKCPPQGHIVGLCNHGNSIGTEPTTFIFNYGWWYITFPYIFITLVILLDSTP